MGESYKRVVAEAGGDQAERMVEAVSRDATGNGTLGGMIESGGVHSNSTLFQKAISESSLLYKQPREIADSEDYSKLSRCFTAATSSARRAQLGRNWITQGCSLASCAEVDHEEVLEGVWTFTIRSTGLWR